MYFRAGVGTPFAPAENRQEARKGVTKRKGGYAKVAGVGGG